MSVWPGFTWPEDWREAESRTCTERDGLLVRQWTADATDDHGQGKHAVETHPWCTPCEIQAAGWDAGDPEALEACTPTVHARALRYLRLHGRPPRPQEPQPAREPFDAGTLSEVLARPAEPPMRVDGLIPSDAGALLVAQRKTGKTTAELNYARCLLTGEPFLSTFDVRPVAGSVALLNYEVSAAQIARWAHEHHVPADRLLLVTLRGRRNPLADPEDRAELATLLRSHDTEAVIVDPFGRAYTGTSQNDSGEVGAWLVDLDRFVRAEVGATDLLLSAHAGWNGERTRGSSALEDWADVVITMTRDEDEDGDRYLRAIGRDVDLDEDRLTFDPHTRTLALTGHGSRKTARTTRKVEELTEFVIRAARSDPGISYARAEAAIREMPDNPGFRKGDVAKAARAAQVAGDLHIGSAARGAAALFALDTPTSPTSPDLPPGPLTTSPTSPYRGEVGGGQVNTTDLPPSAARPKCSCHGRVFCPEVISA